MVFGFKGKFPSLVEIFGDEARARNWPYGFSAKKSLNPSIQSSYRQPVSWKIVRVKNTQLFLNT
ncbi:MAG: hypothetical protein A3G99_02210 [Candidatus Zambryskibacteria bacterium RIFCSPLOWO2_12_FULL_39_23]|uniref:Uncharacterized protein n=1 Tax=Candidatus Zambryskibacteria bacterium RIFCSPLOWO2_12_FULL_39_23 TaxID=1802776 RepID=A0A1G2UTZ0_9BACT|nr:MAG: hypothetical protein A3G99_02210 [Candidatus Zambryskibacteria bacterium RIFCSPLOWO2_12_FULL_39_23]